MLEALSRICGSICLAEDRGQVGRALDSATALLGFDSFNMSLGKRHPSEFMAEPTFTTWTAEELADYARNGWPGRDPLLEHLAAGGPPLLWDPTRWHGSEHRDYAAYIDDVGIHRGLSVPLPSQRDRRSAITLLSYRPRSHRREVAAAVNMLGMVAMGRAAALGLDGAVPRHTTAGLALLSGRQLEILRWIAAGKSNAEIAVILGQTRRGVDYHVVEILKKLGVGSRVQAASIYASSGHVTASA